MRRPTPPVAASLGTTSVLAGDTADVADIPVDLASPAPMAVFRDPARACSEAFLVSGGGLKHLRHDPASPTGWRLDTPPWLAPGAFVPAREVVVAVHPDGTPTLFYSDGDHTHRTSLGADRRWSAPTAVPGRAATNLRVAYTQVTGHPVVYAAESSTVLGIHAHDIARGERGWSYQSVPLAVAPALDLRGGQSFLQVEQWAIDGHEFYFWQLAVSPAADDVRRDTQIFTGQLLPAESQASRVPQSAPMTFSRAVLAMVDDYTAVCCGYNGRIYCIHGGTRSSPLGTPPFVSPIATIARPAATSPDFAAMSAFFAVDTARTLWAVRQTAWTADQPFATAVPIATGMDAVFSDPRSYDAPALFAVDTDARLWLLRQDPATGAWTTGAVQVPGPRPRHARRYRAEVTAHDADGRPIPDLPLTLSVASTTELAVHGQRHLLDATRSLSVTTDRDGKLTITTPADDLTPAPFLVSAPGLPARVVHPALPAHAWFAGEGPLPGLPPLSGAALQSATVDHQPLVSPIAWRTADDPVGLSPSLVADDLRNLARRGFDPLAPAPDHAGFLVRRDPHGGLHHRRFATRSDLLAHRARDPHTDVPRRGDFNKRWSGDLWLGVHRGTVLVTEVVVDLAGGGFTLTVQDLGGPVDVAISCLEDAFHGIAAIFNALAVLAEQLLDWLAAPQDPRAPTDPPTPRTRLPLFPSFLLSSLFHAPGPDLRAQTTADA